MNRLHPILLGLLALFIPAASAHIGNLDQNGGHYYGRSYHCHMPGCVYPDTFTRIGSERMVSNRRARERFFNTDDWNFELDFDGDCQSTRQEVLILTSRVPVRYTNPRNCVVRTGEWVDEYTGEGFEVAMQLDVDHVIPLMYAHTHGGDRWDPGTKLQFANDPLNIMMVDRREIRRKRDRGAVTCRGSNSSANTCGSGTRSRKSTICSSRTGTAMPWTTFLRTVPTSL